eukprot:7707847-Pyramimonas_sp.AAC.1
MYDPTYCTRRAGWLLAQVVLSVPLHTALVVRGDRNPVKDMPENSGVLEAQANWETNNVPIPE